MRPFELGGKECEGIPILRNQNRLQSERIVPLRLLLIAVSYGTLASLIRLYSNAGMVHFWYITAWLSALLAIFGYSFEGTNAMRPVIETMAASSRVGLVFSTILLILTAIIQPNEVLAGFLWEYYELSLSFYSKSLIEIKSFLKAQWENKEKWVGIPKERSERETHEKGKKAEVKERENNKRKNSREKQEHSSRR